MPVIPGFGIFLFVLLYVYYFVVSGF
jgi:hypothetical protein